MFEIDTKKTVCFTGHRDLENHTNEIKSLLKAELLHLIDCGFDTFLTGMAMGFDLLSGEVVLEIKREMPEIRLVAVIPCDNQNARFPMQDKRRYERLLNLANEVVYTGHKYDFTCMQTRNRFLVDHSSLTLSFLQKGNGGTFNTVCYSNELGHKNLNLADRILSI